MAEEKRLQGALAGSKSGTTEGSTLDGNAADPVQDCITEGVVAAEAVNGRSRRRSARQTILVQGMGAAGMAAGCWSLHVLPSAMLVGPGMAAQLHAPTIRHSILQAHWHLQLLLLGHVA